MNEVEKLADELQRLDIGIPKGNRLPEFILAREKALLSRLKKREEDSESLKRCVKEALQLCGAPRPAIRSPKDMDDILDGVSTILHMVVAPVVDEATLADREVE